MIDRKAITPELRAELAELFQRAARVKVEHGDTPPELLAELRTLLGRPATASRPRVRLWRGGERR